MRIDRKPSNQINFKIFYTLAAFAIVQRVPFLAGMEPDIALAIEAGVAIGAGWLIPDVKLGK